MLTERQVKILEFIVNNFIHTGLPTGSRTISKMTLLDVSAATIRNEMADLEELGYIFQPHVSAGRVPSELGLRFHVDNLKQAMSHHASEQIRELLTRTNRLSRDILPQAAQLLSKVTQMTAIVTGSGFYRQTLQNLKLVRISSRRVLLVLVGDREEYQTLPLDMDGYSQAELDGLSALLFDALSQCSLEAVNFKKIYELTLAFPEYGPFIDYLIPVLKKVSKDLIKEDIYVSGREYSIDTAQKQGEDGPVKLMSFLKDYDALQRVLSTDVTKVHVRIGHEIGLDLLEDFSLIQASFGPEEAPVGKIAVLGPLRMDYEHVMAEVRSVQQTLNAMFKGIHL